MSKYAVIVSYGRLRKTKSSVSFIKMLKLNEYEILYFDNKNEEVIVEGVVLPQKESNKYFEFSAYQMAMKYILSISDSSLLNVLFLNDTIFTSHVTNLFTQVTKEIFKNNSSKEYLISGLVESRFHGDIIPSCYLHVSGCRNKMSNFNFLADVNERLKGCSNELWIEPREKFEKHIYKWLYPKSLLSGWYKASHKLPISREVYQRKRLAIYLEHSLLKYNSCDVNAINKNNMLVSSLKFLDRLYNLHIKIMHRIR